MTIINNVKFNIIFCPFDKFKESIKASDNPHAKIQKNILNIKLYHPFDNILII